MAQAILIRSGTELLGPFTSPEIRDMALCGEIEPDTELCLVDLKWSRASSFKNLTFATASEALPGSSPNDAMRPAPLGVTEVPPVPALVIETPPPSNGEDGVSVAATTAGAEGEAPGGRRSFFSKLSQVKDQALTAGEDQLKRQLPKIRELLMTKLGPAAAKTVRDDAKLTAALGYVYEALPYPVRLAVNQERFVAFCLKNRAKLLPEARSDSPPPASEALGEEKIGDPAASP